MFLYQRIYAVHYVMSVGMELVGVMREKSVHAHQGEHGVGAIAIAVQQVPYCGKDVECDVAAFHHRGRLRRIRRRLMCHRSGRSTKGRSWDSCGVVVLMWAFTSWRKTALMDEVRSNSRRTHGSKLLAMSRLMLRR